MKKNIILWIVAIALIITAIIVAVSNNSNKAINGKYSMAQDFTVTDLDGNSVKLSDFRGQYVFLNFWATWCPPCKAEMPEIEKIRQLFPERNLVILAVSTGEDKSTVAAFIKQYGYTFDIALDTNQSVASKYNITGIPTSFFIDMEGNIVAKAVGGLSESAMMNYVNQLISK
jgi:peroxiredoxin